MDECSETLNDSTPRKKYNPRNNAIPKDALSHSIKLGMLSEEQFQDKYPEAYELCEFFKKTRCNAGLSGVLPRDTKKSRVHAVHIVKDQNYIEKEFKAAIHWAFSEEKYKDDFWCHIPVNHLGTIITISAQLKEKALSIQAKKKKDENDGLDKYKR